MRCFTCLPSQKLKSVRSSPTLRSLRAFHHSSGIRCNSLRINTWSSLLFHKPFLFSESVLSEAHWGS